MTARLPGPPSAADLRAIGIRDEEYRTIVTEAFPALDGLHYNSRFAGQPCIALFTPATTAMPRRPALSLPLANPGLAIRIATAAQRLGQLTI